MKVVHKSHDEETTVAVVKLPWYQRALAFLRSVYAAAVAPTALPQAEIAELRWYKVKIFTGAGVLKARVQGTNSESAKTNALTNYIRTVKLDVSPDFK